MVSHHPVALAGALDLERPLILQRMEDEFVPAVLEELKTEAGWKRLLGTTADSRDENGFLRLYQPVHRTFHLVLVEAHCETFGNPRLGRDRIVSAGLVIRRLVGVAREEEGESLVAEVKRKLGSARKVQGKKKAAKKKASKKGGASVQAKKKAGSKAIAGKTVSQAQTLQVAMPMQLAPLGTPQLLPSGIDLPVFGSPAAAEDAAIESWQERGDVLTWMGQREPDRDPVPGLRPPAGLAGHPVIDRLLADVTGELAWEERTTQLFVAPREVCEAAGRTILFGLVPTTSPEVSSEQVQDALLGTALQAAPVGQLLEHGVVPRLPTGGSWPGFAYDGLIANRHLALADLALQLGATFDAFGDTPEAKALREALDKVWLRFGYGPYETRRELGSYLYEVYLRTLELDGAPTGNLVFPREWPVLEIRERNELRTLLRASLRVRLGPIERATNRFADARRLFRARAFVRVDPLDGCPPKIKWSEYSEPFRIVPWYEGGDAKPPVIPLPNPSRKVLKRIKPNVAFTVPEALYTKINKLKMKSLLGDEAPREDPTGFDWIIAFNFLIVFICAFILLMIVASLLDIIFRWMPYFIIRIPIPRGSATP